MEFDIIPINQSEVDQMSVVQMKMLRTAQQKKNDLLHKAEKELEDFKEIVLSNGMKNSTLVTSKEEDLKKETDYQVAILADNLLYNLKLNEPTTGGDIGGEGGDTSAGYIVDYSLSYYERYVIVRDYYLSISDPEERLAQFAADEVAQKYLSTYYVTLFDFLQAQTK